MITPRQHARHTAEWSKLCAALGWNPKSDEVRLAFYREAGLPESRKDWHPVRDFDTFLDACRRLQGGRGDVDRERTRLVFSIRTLAAKGGLDDAYLRKVSTDLTGLACWDELALDQLTNLRNVIANRTGHKRAAARRMTLSPSKKFHGRGGPQSGPARAEVPSRAPAAPALSEDEPF